MAMTMPSSIDTVVVTDSASTAPHYAYVDWPAIFAGIVLASAVALVMLTFGSAIGLSFANFRGGTGVSPVWVAIAAATWLLWVEVSSMMAGGYLAGRLRRRAHDASEHESDVRDGAHGLIVWAGALLIGAVIAVGGVGAAVGAIGNMAGTATTAAASAAGPAAGAAASKLPLDPNAYFADTLFRPASPAAGAAAAAPAAAGTAGASTGSRAANAASATSDATAEAGRILTQGAATGTVSDEDKSYLAQSITARTGISADDAKKRVDTVLGNIDAAKAKAADAAETARKTGVLAAFLTAASLLVAAAGAYWAAMQGGNHRDKQTVFESWFQRY
jgi:hypothetical protein